MFLSVTKRFLVTSLINFLLFSSVWTIFIFSETVHGFKIYLNFIYMNNKLCSHKINTNYDDTVDLVYFLDRERIIKSILIKYVEIERLSHLLSGSMY